MELRRESKVMQCIICALVSIIMITVTSVLSSTDLTSTIFGVMKQPFLPPIQIISKPLNSIEGPISQPVAQTDLSGYKHYTDKNGDEVMIVPARYEAKTDSAPVQAASKEVSPQLPQQVQQPVQQPQTRMAPLQAAPPLNLALVAMNAAANAHSGMNVFESCRCNNGLAAKGDLKQEVLEKCEQPVSRQFTGSRDCSEIWLYNFGPNEFMQGVCFDRGRVNKVLSLNYGY